jgi:cationic peptide transport system ATP-binding protein
MSMRSQLINLMLELQEKQGISYIYVTQHLGMMKHISDQVLVMHNGEVVERGSTADVLASPLHDLTRRLIAGHFGEALTADAWRKDGNSPVSFTSLVTSRRRVASVPLEDSHCAGDVRRQPAILLPARHALAQQIARPARTRRQRLRLVKIEPLGRE